ncbi:HYC_CC_PP family protein [Sunxiuqinia indica]|uniref:HYC_CC_PP family protein n=1 Tax=Sunxiuqinia indica TaxID=2692584 RepID=UPI001356DAB5|nr:hypothetical protein [Sunxiuqinia indica]
MKRALVVILSVFYLLVTVGLAVQVQYCSGEILSVQLFSETNSCCGEASFCDTDCCHNQSQVIQFEEQQTLLSNSKLKVEQPMSQQAVSTLVYSPDFFAKQDAPFVRNTFYPPPNEPVWLLHCSLVYYG